MCDTCAYESLEKQLKAVITNINQNHPNDISVIMIEQSIETSKAKKQWNHI